MSAKHQPAMRKRKAPAHQEAHKHHAHHEHKNQEHHAAHQHHHHASAPRGNESLKNAAIVVLSLALVALLIWSFAGNHDTDKKGSSQGSTVVAAQGQVMDQQTLQAMKTLADDDPFLGTPDAPVVMVEFSDFQCPYCGKFYSETEQKLRKEFVDTGVVKLVYRDLPLSFHANAQNAAEAAECANEQGKYWEYHDKLFSNQDKLDIDSLKKYAADLGLDVAQFDDCLSTHKYADEIAADAAAAQANGITGTPGFIINGQKISGAQPYDKFVQTICAIVPESEPCKNVKPPVPVKVTVLNDKTCASCDASQLEATTKSLFPGATFKEVDVSSAEGKVLIDKYAPTFAPAFFFTADVAQTSTWQTRSDLAGYFDQLDDGTYRLKDSATGANWYLDPVKRAEAQAKLNEQLGLVPGDNKPQVDFFVMSFCPYGNQAEELLKPVYDELKGKAVFHPRYVIYTQGTGCYTDTDGTQLCSLHGGQELNQDVREMCVYNDQGEQAWFDFALAMNDKCTAQNADTCWTDVAKGLGLDTDKIQSCFDANKLTYARQELELNQALGVSGSPTLFFEGQLYNGARTSSGYQSALCAGFDGQKPAGCSVTLDESAAAATAQGSC